eukprot:9474859-Pyramimonas_sp.AAC.1
MPSSPCSSSRHPPSSLSNVSLLIQLSILLSIPISIHCHPHPFFPKKAAFDIVSAREEKMWRLADERLEWCKARAKMLRGMLRGVCRATSRIETLKKLFSTRTHVGRPLLPCPLRALTS